MSFAGGFNNSLGGIAGGGVSGGLGGLLGSTLGTFGGGVAGVAGQALGNYFFGKSAGQQGRDAKAFADNAYPGTSAYDQLGGGSAAASIGGAEKAAKAQRITSAVQANSQRQQMQTQKEVARKQSLAGLSGLYAENPEMAEYLANKIDSDYKGNKNKMNSMHEKSNTSNRGGWSSPRVLRGLANGIETGLQGLGNGKGGSRENDTTEQKIIEKVREGVTFLIKKGKMKQNHNFNYWELGK